MSNSSQEAAIQSQISSSQSKKIDADNLSRVNGAFKDMILRAELTERKRERNRSLLCYNRHRFCCLGERNER